MAGGSMLTLFHLVMIHHSASLPQWVYRVNSCPDPKNISQWIEASKRLNCYHNLTSNDPTKQERIYHCLPSSFLNETLEFCSRSVLINSGNCPVYSYAFGTSIEPFPYDCTDFISGCPTAMFKSKEVYKFPECLKLRPKLRCYEAEKNCTSMSNTTQSNGKSNGGNLVTFLICICVILSILVAVVIILYLLLSLNELTSDPKLSDPRLLQHCLYPQQKYSKVNFCGGNARDSLEYIEITTTNLVRCDLENDPLLSPNVLTSDVKLSDPPLLQPCFYTKREYSIFNTQVNFCGGNARDYLEYIEITTSNLLKRDLENGPSCHPCLYLCAETCIIGYVNITNTAMTLNEMVKTSLVSCNLSSMRNCFVETEGSMKDNKKNEDRSESRCTQTSIHLTKHGNFDMIMIIGMEKNEWKGKKMKHSNKILFKEPKKNKEMLCSKFEKRILHQKKSVLAHALRKMDSKDWTQQNWNCILYFSLSNHAIFHLNYEQLET